MNNKLIKFTFIFLLISIVDAQWESRTAFTIEKSRKEIGLLSPLRIGLQNGSELVINKFLLMPNISIKQGRPAFNQWSMAQRFQIEYPSLGMKWLQSPLGMELGDPNMFALISPEFNIPQMLSFYTEIIGTTGSITNGRLTLNGGIGFSLNGKDLSDDATIDLPIIYPRLSIYYNQILVKMGGEYNKQITDKISYLIDYDMYLMPNGRGRYAFEQKGLIVWERTEKFRILFGYKLIAGEYPFGTQAHFLPLLDLQFGW